MTPTVGTAVARHELPLARVLAADLARVHPGWRLTVLLMDGDPAAWLDEPFEVVGIGDLEIADLGLLLMACDGPGALAAALRPVLLAYLAQRANGVAIWLDATVRVLAPLDELLVAAREGLALVPLHAGFGPAPGLAVRGAFETGVVGASDLDALAWWAELTEAGARRQGARFDPRAGDALASLAGAAGQVAILRGGTFCAGWWTVAAGSRIEGDPPTLGGEPLAALNFAGFDPRRPHWLSDEDPAGLARVSSSPALASLLARHAGELLDAGWAPASEGWSYATLPNGVALDDDLRDLFAVVRRHGEQISNPFTDEGCEAFMRWVDSESPIGAGVTWYLERVHRRRADLQAAFPDLGGGDGWSLAEWMERHGGDEEPVLAALLRRRSPTSASSARDTDASVRIVGFLGDGLGLGEAARSYARALQAVDVDVDTVSLPAPMMSGGGDRDRFWSRREVMWAASDRPVPSTGVEIVCMNPPELVRAHRAGVVSAERGHRIGVWAWELDSLPSDWAEAFPLVDEVWAYSEYVAAVLRPAVPVPVTVMPLAVEAPEPADTEPDGSPFTFLFAFDLLSSVERKNPIGLIEAFRSAFEPGEGPRLLLKTTNGDNAPETLERVRVAALGCPDIEVVDEFLSAADRDALIGGCDCYVSLHRAEGFGLTIAEAMAAARPVIATGFSGNLDFMTDATGYLVSWEPAEVEEGSPIYPAGARWAEPDVDHAASLMRRVYADPVAARVRGRLARKAIAELASPEVVGRRMCRRIEEAETAPKGGLRGVFARRRGT